MESVKDGAIRFDGIVTVRREPDGISLLDGRYVTTDDEDDLVIGSRTWAVFDTRDGTVVFSADGECGQLAARAAPSLYRPYRPASARSGYYRCRSATNCSSRRRWTAEMDSAEGKRN